MVLVLFPTQHLINTKRLAADWFLATPLLRYSKRCVPVSLKTVAITIPPKEMLKADRDPPLICSDNNQRETVVLAGIERSRNIAAMAKPLATNSGSHILTRFASGVEAVMLRPQFVPLCFFAFVVLRLALVIWVPVTPSSDFLWYHDRAIDLIEGRGYSEDGVPTAYWPVGWPAVAALLYKAFGANPSVLQTANLLFASASFFLVLALGRAMFASEVTARIGVLLLTVYPNNIAYVSLTATETFYTFLLLLGTWLFIARRTLPTAILCGLVFGYATLTKPQTLFMPAILVGISFLFEAGYRLRLRTLVHGAIVGMAMAIVISPWIYRNYLVFGEPVFISTNSGWALYVGNNPSVLANRGFPTDTGPEVKALWNETFTVVNQLQSSRAARAAAVQWIKENPGTYLLLMPIKAFSLWSVDGEAEWAYQRGAPSYKDNWPIFRTIRIVNQALYVFLFLGFFAGGVTLLRRYWRQGSLGDVSTWALTGYGFAAYTTLQCMLLAGSFRYKFPLMPFVILACAWAITVWLASRTAGGSHQVGQLPAQVNPWFS